ncbi:MAG: hypothetical protein IPI66_13280 [Chitinophagaceae bacterium]|nr:hypothetical protein [Chitinophagaceae bacterium]
MRPLFVLCIALTCFSGLRAQKDSADKIMVFKITGYAQAINDSMSILQVVKPDTWPFSINMKQVAILRHHYVSKQAFDTALIGTGKCALIKGEYHYFTFKFYPGQRATEGDLLYTRVRIPLVYDGLLLNVLRHDIGLTDIDEKPFLSFTDLFDLTREQEQNLLDKMVADIRYTGKAMIDHNPGVDKDITEGLYKGKKVLAAMLTTNRSDLELFLNYVMVRPGKYAGSTWKISEIFATWMEGGAPHVIK